MGLLESHNHTIQFLQRKIRATETLDELKRLWGDIAPAYHPHIEVDKNARKDELQIIHKTV